MQRLLLVTLSNIGDAVMTTPVLEALHQRYPQAGIDVVCDPRSSGLFESCPYVTQLFVRDKKTGWLGYIRLINRLRRLRYDIVVDLRTDFLVHLLRATTRYKKIPNDCSLHLHSVEKHMLAVRPLLGDIKPKLMLWASKQDEIEASARFPLHGRWLAIGLGANFAGKIWPVDRYAEVANAMQAEFAGVVLLGGVADKRLAEQFIAQSLLPVHNTCGSLSLSQSYALLNKCHFYLGNDSGLGHMAAAAGLPTLTLFGVGSPRRYRPWSEQSDVIQDPRQKIMGITVKEVIVRMQSWFAQAGSDSE